MLQDTSVYKIPSFRTRRWDRTGRERSYCRHLQGRRGSAPCRPRRRKVSQAQNRGCAPQSAGPPLMCALSPEGLLTASPCFGSSLNTCEVSTTHLKGVWGGSGLVLLLFFPHALAPVRKFSVFRTCMAGAAEWGRIAKRNGWPNLSSSEGWEAKYDGRDRILQPHLCQGDFSPPLALSSAEAELKLEAGTGFLRKEEKLGNVY